MSRVFIVFSGSYSERSTDAVFDNEQSAKNHIENMRDRKKDGSAGDYDDWDIEEWEVNTTEPLLSRSVWRVDMFKNGTTVHTGREPNGTETKIEFSMHWEFLGGTSSRLVGPKMICYCEADDEKHAVKITNEKRIMAIANNQWPDKV